MNIEDEHPSTLPLQQLVADQTKRAKLVRILLHSLHAMGFKESALQLEKESNLHYQEQAEQIIRQRFQKRQYQQIFPIIQRMSLPPIVKEEVNLMLAELKVFTLINSQQYEAAIENIYKHWANQEEKQLNFLSFIAIGKTIEAEDFSVLEQQILSKCITDSLHLKTSIQQMLKGYLGLPQLSPLTLQDHRPPQNVVASSQSLTYVGKITFVRLHPNQKTICLVAEHSKETEVSIWDVRGAAIKKDISWHADHFGCINTVQWDKNGDRLAICSYTKIALLQLNAETFKPSVIIDAKDLFHSKLLVAKWSPDGRLFVGGLFEGLGVTDNRGNMIQMIQPFIRTRNLIFESSGQLIAINATRGQLIRFSCESQQIVTSFQSSASFMDLRMDVKTGLIVATNKQFIYLLDARTLKPIATFNSPDNEKMWKIQAFLFKGWLLIFNEKLSALMQNKQASRHHSWPDCDAVDVSNGRMVTANQRITLWDSEYSAPKSKSEKQSKRGRVLSNGYGDDIEFRSISSPSDKSDSEEEVGSVLSELSDNFVQIEYVENEDDDEQEFQEE